MIPKGGSDEVYTPPELAQQIVDYFDPFGQSIINLDSGELEHIKLLEPCYGRGAFVNAFIRNANNNGIHAFEVNAVNFCDINIGIDFLKFPNPEKDFIPYRYDYVITNPPFSQFRAFLNKSMEIADNVIFLSLINAFFFKARFRDIKEQGFGFKEIIAVDTPPQPWPQFGIQLGVVHLQKGYTGDTKFTYGFPQTV